MIVLKDSFDKTGEKVSSKASLSFEYRPLPQDEPYTSPHYLWNPSWS